MLLLASPEVQSHNPFDVIEKRTRMLRLLGHLPPGFSMLWMCLHVRFSSVHEHVLATLLGATTFTSRITHHASPVANQTHHGEGCGNQRFVGTEATSQDRERERERERGRETV